MEKAIVKIIKGKYNVNSIADDIASEMKEHGSNTDDYDDYWCYVYLILNSHDSSKWELAALKEVVESKIRFINII